MIICQYDIQKLDLNTIEKVIQYITENVDEKETVIAVPSGLSIVEFSEEDAIEVLEQLHKFLGKNIALLKNKEEIYTDKIADAIEFLENFETYSDYQDAWNTVCKYYGIEKEIKNG